MSQSAYDCLPAVLLRGSAAKQESPDCPSSISTFGNSVVGSLPAVLGRRCRPVAVLDGGTNLGAG